MAQPHEFLTYQLYQEYHKRVHSTREMDTYMHFGAVSRTNAASQTELLTGYMKAMIESIINDMNRFGDCWLLQAILGHELPAVHVLDYSALVYVHTSVFHPEDRPRLNTRSIPYTSEFSSSSGGLLYADPHAPSYTVDIREERLLHHQCRALQLNAQKKALLARIEATGNDKTALNSQIAGLKDQIFGLEHDLTEARAALHDAASAAFAAEKQQLLDEAHAQARQIIESANAVKVEAEKQQAAVTQARQALAAELEAVRRQHEEALAGQEAAMRSRLADDARQQTALTREALRQEFAQSVDASAYMDVRSAMSETSIAMQRDMTQQLEASVNTFHEAKDAMVREVDVIKANMEEKLDSFLGAFDRLKRELVQSVADAAEHAAQTRRDLAEAMDESAAAVSSTKGSMMQELQGWRTKLFKQDAARLTSVYSSLYVYANRRFAQDASQLLLTLDPEKDAATIALINSMQNKCTSMLVSLEAAMRDLGMVLFTPGENEPFDDTIHRAVNEEALFEDTSANVVRACSIPGVRMASDESLILRKAEVFVAEDSAC